MLLMTGICQPAIAQDDDEVVYADGAQTETTVVKKKKVAKRPDYPTMEVKGTIIDAVTKAPLAGIQIRTLNDQNYAAMTDGKGNFTIKVPTFSPSVFV